MRLLCIPPFVLAGDLTSWGFILAAALCLAHSSVAGQAKRLSFAPARERTAARRRGRKTTNFYHHTHHGGHD